MSIWHYEGANREEAISGVLSKLVRQQERKIAAVTADETVGSFPKVETADSGVECVFRELTPMRRTNLDADLTKSSA